MKQPGLKRSVSDCYENNLFPSAVINHRKSLDLKLSQSSSSMLNSSTNGSTSSSMSTTSSSLPLPPISSPFLKRATSTPLPSKTEAESKEKLVLLWSTKFQTKSVKPRVVKEEKKNNPTEIQETPKPKVEPIKEETEDEDDEDSGEDQLLQVALAMSMKPNSDDEEMLPAPSDEEEDEY